MPSLSEAEEAYSAQPGGSADVSHLQAERQRSRMRLSSIARLEQVASPRSYHCVMCAYSQLCLSTWLIHSSNCTRSDKT